MNQLPIDSLEVVRKIIKNKRRKNANDLDAEITNQEQDDAIINALKAYHWLQEKSIDGNCKILIESKQGLIKTTEEVVLQF